MPQLTTTTEPKESVPLFLRSLLLSLTLLFSHPFLSLTLLLSHPFLSLTLLLSHPFLKLSFPKGICVSPIKPPPYWGAQLPPREYQFRVYILSNRSHILYIGVTNNLRKRIDQHHKQTPGSFTTRYKITRLVYFESYQYINTAIAREKELKHWTRAQKIALIESVNPTWEELPLD